jgi:hypothetical protein
MAIIPVLPFIMIPIIMEETSQTTLFLVMVHGATLAMDLAHLKIVVSPFAALLATTPAIVLLPAQVVREEFMMVPVVAPTAVITLHARVCEVSLEKDKRLMTSFCTF